MPPQPKLSESIGIERSMRCRIDCLFSPNGESVKDKHLAFARVRLDLANVLDSPVEKVIPLLGCVRWSPTLVPRAYPVPAAKS